MLKILVSSIVSLAIGGAAAEGVRYLTATTTTTVEAAPVVCPEFPQLVVIPEKQNRGFDCKMDLLGRC
jgi:hypothetical protein